VVAPDVCWPKSIYRLNNSWSGFVIQIWWRDGFKIRNVVFKIINLDQHQMRFLPSTWQHYLCGLYFYLVIFHQLDKLRWYNFYLIGLDLKSTINVVEITNLDQHLFPTSFLFTDDYFWTVKKNLIKTISQFKITFLQKLLWNKCRVTPNFLI